MIKSREIVIRAIRDFFKNEGFIEVETPLMVSAPDPSFTNEVFETSPVLGKRMFLAPSPEFFMKKIIALEKIPKTFQICKAFRNPQELDPLHNPEFTILEWYRVGADYTDLMEDCENLVKFIYKSFSSQIKNEKVKMKNDKEKIKNFLSYQGQKINITPPWPRTTIKEAFKKYANIDLDKFLDFMKAKEIARQKGYKINKETTWEQIYHQIFLNEIEPKLPKESPLILYDYPAPLAALSKIKKSDPKYAQRFEFYIGGLELGNGYSELTDWQEQEKRLKDDLLKRKRLGMKVFDYDHEFIEALKKGLPECAGIAVGVDRLVMLFTDSKTIQEVISFPAIKIFG